MNTIWAIFGIVVLIVVLWLGWQFWWADTISIYRRRRRK